MSSTKNMKKSTIISAIIFLLIFLLWQSHIFTLLPFFVQTWELPSGSHTIAFSSDGTMVAIGAGKPTSYKITRNSSISGVPSTVEIRRVADSEIIQALKFPNATSITFSFDNKLIAAGHQGREIKVWQVGDGKLISTFEQSGFKQFGSDLSFVEYLAFTPDGQTLVSFTQKYSSSSKTRPDTVDVWNIDNGESRRILSKNFSCAVVNPDGKLFAIGSRDKVNQTVTLSLYEIESGTLLKVFDNQPKNCSDIQFSKDSKLLSSFNLEQKKVDVYDVKTGKLIRSQNIRYVERNNLVVSEIVFSPDANYLAIAYRAASIEGGFIFPSIPKTFFGRISIWNTENGRLITTVMRSNKSPSALTFSPDGKLIASAEKDSTIRLWKVPDNNHNWLWLLSAGGLAAIIYWQRNEIMTWLNR